MRIATYNVEWMNALFSHDGKILDDDGPSARYKTTRSEQLGSLGIVFTAMDADAVLIVEAPDQNRRRTTDGQLEAFAAKFGLRTRKAVMGFASDTEQEIALLYDPDRLTAVHDPKGPATARRDATDVPRFDGTFRIDLDNDGHPEAITFSKPPLELAVTAASGFRFRMIGVHAKSKAPHGVNTPEEAIRLAIENRRKQLAQCIWLRGRVDEHLAVGDPVIVLGDFNDGPGLDEYEKLFGHSGVEIMLGLDRPPKARLTEPHALMALGRRIGVEPATARFWLAEKKHYFPALLDYIMVSDDLMARAPDWRVWHPFDDPVCYRTPELREALLAASDHFPVTLDIAL
ncbi:MAG: endonuclease [Paracoccaceae bacterium]|nr:endonuclease [Paracoccaceae bacterium]MDE3122965.1 endonuclease [Paracoccaceae bacterium]MDE3240002.1 endonuclease [Paracoccaceae bacterium]